MRFITRSGLGHDKWRDLIANNPILYFLIGMTGVLFLFLVLVMLSPLSLDPRDFIMQLFGFLLDIILFGVLFSIYDRWREQRARIRDYSDALKDFALWKGPEAILRKMGLIRRLSELRAPIPSLAQFNLEEADLSRINLAGVDFSRSHLERIDLFKAYLPGARFTAAHLDGAQLSVANLENADLSYAHLKRAYLQYANLKNADLSWAYMAGAILANADLTGARLAQANLEGVDLSGANLAGADLSEAIDLTWKQLELAKRDSTTRLPEYLTRESFKTTA